MTETETAEVYTSGRAIELTGITVRQLDYWATKGLLRPRGGIGSGVRRLWTIDEINVMSRIVRLVRVGLTPELATTVARYGNGTVWQHGGVGITLSPWDLIT